MARSLLSMTLRAVKAAERERVRSQNSAIRQHNVDLSRFDAAPLIAFTATKETDYGTETNRRI